MVPRVETQCGRALKYQTRSQLRVEDMGKDSLSVTGNLSLIKHSNHSAIDGYERAGPPNLGS